VVELLESARFLIIAKVEDSVIAKVSDLLHYFNEVLMGQVRHGILSIEIGLNINSYELT
jgi:hypothetical protein